MVDFRAMLEPRVRKKRLQTAPSDCRAGTLWSSAVSPQFARPGSSASPPLGQEKRCYISLLTSERRPNRVRKKTYRSLNAWKKNKQRLWKENKQRPSEIPCIWGNEKDVVLLRLYGTLNKRKEIKLRFSEDFKFGVKKKICFCLRYMGL